MKISFVGVSKTMLDFKNNSKGAASSISESQADNDKLLVVGITAAPTVTSGHEPSPATEP